MARFQTVCTAGLLVRGTLRRSLRRIKEKIEWGNSDARITITEDKGFLESDITFTAEGLTNDEALALKRWYEDMQS